jgi:xanthine/CO dehydrogenase XdhC/CoxF family maturation factor
MKELETILAAARDAQAAGKTLALATVVDVAGSAYRLPGARMLIADGKWIGGSISGGCLEDDVVLRAAEAVARHEAIVTTYDTTLDDDIVFGVGLGCKGIITVLIEPLRSQSGHPDLLAFAESCLERREPGVVATVVRVNGRSGAKPGSRLTSSSGGIRSDISDAGLRSKIESIVPEITENARLVTVQLEDGAADVFVERIVPPTPLVVFGAGHDAIPLVALAKHLGWHVTVVDHRPAYATSVRFPRADRIVISTPAEVSAKVPLSRETLAIVMTHNYLRDLDLVQLLLPSPVAYVGLLGPRRRTDQLLGDLKQKGIQPSPEQLTRFYAPVGLDIGSEGPVEVALSILAEMQAVMTAHGGGHLRERKNPIHSDVRRLNVSG